MDANLTMQNNLSYEEPAAYFQRVYKLNRLDASKNEHTYMKLIECGGKISMDDYMELVGRQKPDARTEQALNKHIVSFSEERVEVCEDDHPEKKVPKNMGYGKGGEMVYI